MINIEILTAQVERGLNANTYGLNYKIFADAGSFKQGIKTRKGNISYVNGVMQVISSAIVPIQTLCIATLTARLDIVVQLPSAELDEQTIKTNRAALDEYFAKSAVQALEDDSGKVFTVAVSYSLANTGSIEQRDGLGTSLVFSITISYSFIQNGLNSYNCIFTLDGVQLAYTKANITRVPVMESNPYNANGNSQNIATSSTLSFDLEVPATDEKSTTSVSVLGYILNGSLTDKHILKVTLGGIEKTYTVLFGQVNIALDGVQNAGHAISFVEAVTLKAADNG